MKSGPMAWVWLVCVIVALTNDHALAAAVSGYGLGVCVTKWREEQA